jgi:cyclophilin family peptidyl-prolyl cis-trans isomerase
MKTKSRLTQMFFAMITAAGVAACGADDDKKKDDAAGVGAGDSNPVVEMKTSMGTIKIELDRKNSPITVNNFLKYVEKKHYDNTVFHRVMSTFMIQGGGFEKGDTPLEKDTLPPIRNEAKINGLKNEQYTIAMARTNAPHSATSQFFISVVDNRRSLDAGGGAGPDGYAVFGKVIEGMDVVDKIKAVPVATKQLKSRHGGKIVPGPHQNVPVEQVVIESVRLVESKKTEKKNEGAE